MKRYVITLGFMTLFGCVAMDAPGKVTVQPVRIVEPVAVNKGMQVDQPVMATTEETQAVKVEEPVRESKPKTSNPVQVIESAKEEAIETVSGGKFINAITEYEYRDGKIFKIYCAPGRATDLIFGEGEFFALEDIGDGDTLDQRWKIPLISFSGTGAERRQHLFLKPTKEGLEKNMIIPTNKRVYYLEIKSFSKTFQTAVRWLYPEEENLKKIAKLNDEKESKEQKIKNIPMDKMNFSYEIDGKASFKPESVYDDGSKTYIKFSDKIKQGELPPLFLESKDKKIQLVNCRYISNHYIVDRLIDVAVLKFDDREKVYIYNKSSDRFSDRKTAKRFEHAR